MVSVVPFVLPIRTGALPSFAACVALTQFYCIENQFTGKINLKPFVVPVLHTVLFYFLDSDSISIVSLAPPIRAGALPSFAACTALTVFKCYRNQFTGKLNQKPFVEPILHAVSFC